MERNQETFQREGNIWGELWDVISGIWSDGIHSFNNIYYLLFARPWE